MTEAQLREKVVSQARAWLGCKESDGSHSRVRGRHRCLPLP